MKPWFKPSEYLARIAYEGDLEPSLNTLVALQRAHLLTVPFENLDIHAGVPIILDLERIYHKIIQNHRGGFCYECNGLFFELLSYLGFQARMISARVYGEKKVYGPEFDHLAILVDLPEGRFLTDVGFGEFAMAPLRLELGLLQADPRGVFILDQYGDYLRFQKKEDGKLIPQYMFTEESREYQDYRQMCHYMQTHPDSHFRKKRMITRATLNGRITLNDDELKIKVGEQVECQPINNYEEFERELARYFSGS